MKTHGRVGFAQEGHPPSFENRIGDKVRCSQKKSGTRRKEILVFNKDINFLYMKQKIRLVAEKQGDGDVAEMTQQQKWKKKQTEQSGIIEAEGDHPPYPKRRKKDVFDLDVHSLSSWQGS